MGIQIQNEQHDNVRVLALGGRLDTETAADVEIAFDDLLDAGDRHFLIDLGGIGYVSSAGLRVLLALAKKLDGGKGSLRLCSLTPAVRQVFDVAGFSKLFAIATDRAAALGTPPRPKPAARPSNPMAEHAARLLGLGGKPTTPGNAAAVIAPVAALLLGIQPTAAAAGAKSSSRSLPRTPVQPTGGASAAPIAAESAGVMGKFKRLFGGKR